VNTVTSMCQIWHIWATVFLHALFIAQDAGIGDSAYAHTFFL